MLWNSHCFKYNMFSLFHVYTEISPKMFAHRNLVYVLELHWSTRVTRPVVLLIAVAGLGQVLEFMYTAKLTLSPQNVEDVMTVANFLQMQEIVNACSAYQSMANPAPSIITLDFAVGESHK